MLNLYLTLLKIFPLLVWSFNENRGKIAVIVLSKLLKMSIVFEFLFGFGQKVPGSKSGWPLINSGSKVCSGWVGLGWARAHL